MLGRRLQRRGRRSDHRKNRSRAPGDASSGVHSHVTGVDGHATVETSRTRAATEVTAGRALAGSRQGGEISADISRHQEVAFRLGRVFKVGVDAQLGWITCSRGSLDALAPRLVCRAGAVSDVVTRGERWRDASVTGRTRATPPCWPDRAGGSRASSLPMDGPASSPEQAAQADAPAGLDLTPDLGTRRRRPTRLQAWACLPIVEVATRAKRSAGAFLLPGDFAAR
jgi:hypothetical protein